MQVGYAGSFLFCWNSPSMNACPETCLSCHDPKSLSSAIVVRLYQDNMGFKGPLNISDVLLQSCVTIHFADTGIMQSVNHTIHSINTICSVDTPCVLLTTLRVMLDVPFGYRCAALDNALGTLMRSTTSASGTAIRRRAIWGSVCGRKAWLLYSCCSTADPYSLMWVPGATNDPHSLTWMPGAILKCLHVNGFIVTSPLSPYCVLSACLDESCHPCRLVLRQISAVNRFCLFIFGFYYYFFLCCMRLTFAYSGNLDRNGWGNHSTYFFLCERSNYIAAVT